MGELPEEIQSKLDNLDEALTSMEQFLEPIFDTPWDVLTARLDPVEKAKLNLIMAYCASSLFFMYLKTQGSSTEDHPIQGELSRIHSYIGKLKDVTASAEKEKSRLKLNKEAAQRFIKGSLSRKSFEASGEAEGDVSEAEEMDSEETKPPPGKKANKSK